MDDEVVAFGVIGVAENREGRGGAFVVGVNLIDDDVGAGFGGLLEKAFFFCVFVTATAGGGGVGFFVVVGNLIEDVGGAGLEALLENVFLFGVFVTATAGDEESPDGFGGIG